MINITVEIKKVLHLVGFPKKMIIEEDKSRSNVKEIPIGIWLSPDGQNVVTSHSDGYIKFWSGINAKLVFKQCGHILTPFAIIANINGQTLVTASPNDFICVWDVRKAKILKRFKIECKAIDISNEGNLLAIGDDEGFISVLRLDGADSQIKWKAHDKAITSLRFSPNNKHIYTTSVDKTIGVFKTLGGDLFKRYVGHKSIPFNCILTPDETHVIGLTKGYEMNIFERISGKSISVVETSIIDAFFSSDGKKIVTIHSNAFLGIGACDVVVSQYNNGKS